MTEYIIGFIKGLLGCERNTAVEIFNFIVYFCLGCLIGTVLNDITTSLKRIADNGEKK